MKLERQDDDYIFFTNDIACLGDIDNIDEEKMGKFLKKVFVDISDIYKIDLFGYYRVDIYIDKKIGAYVEISKIDDFISYSKKIDTKVTVSVVNFYFKTKDLSKVYDYRPIYCCDDYYYVSTDVVDDIFGLLDFCSIEYKDINLKNVLS